MIKKETRTETVKRLETNYKGQYGEYMWYAGQSFVFKQGNKINKALLIRTPPDEITPRYDHMFDVREVYKGDSEKDLEKVQSDLKAEFQWFIETFATIDGVLIPKEKYLIGKDPLGSDNLTVVISVDFVDKIQGDIFRIGSQKLYEYLQQSPEFKRSLIELATKHVELGEKDIYTDYFGYDNVVIYLDDRDNPHLAIIDPHLVFYKSKANEMIKDRLTRAHDRLQRFLSDPMDLKNLEHLTSDGLM